MKLKSTVLFLLVIAFVVAVAGCSSDNNGDGVQQVKTNSLPQASQQEQNTSQEQTTPVVKGSFQNPAGINETVTLESTGNTYDASVVKVVRGDEANMVVRGANEFNEKPAPGYDYLLVNMRVAYTKGENSEGVDSTEFKAYCDNVECQQSYVVLPNSYMEFSSGNIMPGGVKEGWIVYTVPQNKEVIMGFQPNFIEGSTAYISIGK